MGLSTQDLQALAQGLAQVIRPRLAEIEKKVKQPSEDLTEILDLLAELESRVSTLESKL